LLTIRFLLRYLSRPLHFFGSMGMAGILIGSAVATWLAVLKFIHPRMDVIDEHGPFIVFSAVLIVAGVQMLALGLLGEMQARHYHEPSRRVPYSVERLLRSPESEQSTLQE